MGCAAGWESWLLSCRNGQGVGVRPYTAATETKERKRETETEWGARPNMAATETKNDGDEKGHKIIPRQQRVARDCC